MRGSARAFAAGGAERTAGSGTIINRVGAPAVQVCGQRGFAELYSTTTRWIPVNGVEAVLKAVATAAFMTSLLFCL